MLKFFERHSAHLAVTQVETCLTTLTLFTATKRRAAVFYRKTIKYETATGIETKKDELKVVGKKKVLFYVCA